MEKFANGTKAILEKVCEATKNGVATVIGKIRGALVKWKIFFFPTPILHSSYTHSLFLHPFYTHPRNSLYFIWQRSRLKFKKDSQLREKIYETISPKMFRENFGCLKQSVFLSIV